MKLDVKGLCKRLAQAKEEAAVSSENCNGYLLDKVFHPLMRNETVLLRDVDFSQSEEEDIRCIFGYYEDLEVQGQKLTQFVGAIANLQPVACKVRHFC